jgi:hypothetical protein
MRSVSIVYKLRKDEPQGTGITRVKRSVDEFFQQLVEREKLREEIVSHKQPALERIRVKTSKRRREDD